MMGFGEGKKSRINYLFTGIYSFIPVVFVAGIVVIASCTKISEFDIGKDFLESQTRLQVIDTYRVDMSTVLLDSLTTSSAEIALVGNYEDEIFGSIKCESYFDLAFENFPDIDEKALFDSSAFILSFSGYSYGDTTSLMSINVHSLIEKITPFENGYLYNNTSFSYEPEAEGTASFYPSPNSSADTSISITVNVLGEELFNLIKSKDETVTSEELFYDYLKGFILTPGNVENKAVIGFDASSGHINLRIYYHIEKEEPIKNEISIKMGAAVHQFNNISYDLTNTALDRIKMEGNLIPSSETDYKGYLQGLVGLMPKIQFPSLQDIFLGDRWKILKAELVIEPVKCSYELFRLPKKLYIFDTDRENRINSSLKDDSGNQLFAELVYDEFYKEDTYYTYDITSFINEELSDSYFDVEHGLLLGLGQEEFISTLDRLLIEGKDPPVKLKLYYLSY